MLVVPLVIVVLSLVMGAAAITAYRQVAPTLPRADRLRALIALLRWGVMPVIVLVVSVLPPGALQGK